MRNPIVEKDLKNIISSDLPWNRLEGKTVLISGAGGFLAAYMVKTLLILNCNVIGVVRNKEKAMAQFSDIADSGRLKLLVQDVCQPISIDGRIDYIIHAASQASPRYYGKDPVGTLSANVLGTDNLLRLARKKEVEGFLFFSSGEVYGEVDSNHTPVKEEYCGVVDTLDVRSCYAESKRIGENMCISWFHQYGVPARIARPFHTYGPGMYLDDGRVYADFICDIVNNRNIAMKSNGAASRAFCYLADATSGFFTVLLRGNSGEAYNVGNDKGEISIRKLADLLVGLFPEKKLSVKEQLQSDELGYLKSKLTRNCPDISKIGLLGWSPKTSIEEGFIRTIKSFEGKNV